MSILAGVFVLIIAFAGMELFSWVVHKYIMHGFLWNIHKTHHRPGKGFFELNDVFSFLFGSIAVLLIFLGMESLDYRFWIGAGITLYGLVYFILHDMVIHRRVKSGLKPESRYLKGIAKAHRDHHKSPDKNGAVSFGLLWVASEYFRRSKK